MNLESRLSPLQMFDSKLIFDMLCTITEFYRVWFIISRLSLCCNYFCIPVNCFSIVSLLFIVG